MWRMGNTDNLQSQLLSAVEALKNNGSYGEMEFWRH